MDDAEDRCGCADAETEDEDGGRGEGPVPRQPPDGVRGIAEGRVDRGCPTGVAAGLPETGDVSELAPGFLASLVLGLTRGHAVFRFGRQVEFELFVQFVFPGSPANPPAHKAENAFHRDSWSMGFNTRFIARENCRHRDCPETSCFFPWGVIR